MANDDFERALAELDAAFGGQNRNEDNAILQRLAAAVQNSQIGRLGETTASQVGGGGLAQQP